MPEITLSLHDVLQRPLFSHAEVVAGQAGLQRRIRWVHILEIPFFDETIIQGEELILTTGVGLLWGQISHTEFLQNLIAQKASCLCVELGHYFLTISDEMKALAEEHSFPLIIFHNLVNFIELTQDLHSLIINRHHQTLVKLDQISRSFHALSLTSRATSGIIKELWQHTEAQVIYLPLTDSPVFFPRARAPQEAYWLQAIHEQRALWAQAKAADGPVLWQHDEQIAILLQPIEAVEQTFGMIGLIVTGREADAFDSLILDRAAISLSHDFLRKHYVEEKKAHSEAAWLDDLLHGRVVNEEDIRRFVSRHVKHSAARGYRIMLLELDEAAPLHQRAQPSDAEAFRIHLTLQVRFVFLGQLFHPFMTMHNNQLIVMAIDLAFEQSTARMKKAVETLSERSRYEQFGFAHVRLGIGRLRTAYVQAGDSFREAQQMLRIGRQLERPISPFYEEAGVYRLLLLIEKDAATASFVEDTLAPLIAYDQAKGTELFKTLQVYLAEDGSRQNTAQKLFIVRQTLYHRLEKMKELLGDDFLTGDKRLALEMALRAHSLLRRE